MTQPAVRYDLVIQEGAKFYQEFQQVQPNLVPISLVGYTVRCRIKESFEVSTLLHDLTVANGGVVITDAANGKFAIAIPANLTTKNITKGVYDIMLIDTLYTGIEDERIIEGKVVYTKEVI